ncbi:fructokinase [Agromyces terreus]|uniref:fructokinase n=1 Tax=Agromyces terreus TaxID=424795 RepID=A0A9X2GXB0_9MICO|nr:ROK family protein [Agromyces terreus]MCP2370312.1 fructokinase [Agromyces terreus]
MIAGVETGGTKIICGVADAAAPDLLVDVVEFPTTTPIESGERIRGYLEHWGDRIDRVGVASFGPLDLDPGSPTFGSITTTPKPGWASTPVSELIGAGRRMALVSDVTGAAIGEAAHGAATGVDDVAYVTVGTGIGVGAILAGAPVSRVGHPEMGHLPVRRHPDDRFAGVCPFHGDCIEGLASGPAMAARWGRPTRALGSDRTAAVELESYYLGQLLASVLYSLVPQRIVIGGGVLKVESMLAGTRAAMLRELNGALGADHASTDADAFVVPPRLGDHSGVLGALHLAASLDADTRSLAAAG